uniref:Ground-like domain-containing protein n=1 Tax=Rhabditophanes sp. KR3021 TaxID=114890 RepID=A0AC35U7I2_9BILA
MIPGKQIILVSALLISFCSFSYGQEKMFDVRQMVKSTLDYVRGVPVPTNLQNLAYQGLYQPPQKPQVNGQSVPLGPNLFAAPTKTDVDRLLHLPADILEKLAADAGYLPQYYERRNEYAGSASSNAIPPTMGGFNFGIQNGNDPSQGFNNKAPVMPRPTDNVQIDPTIATNQVLKKKESEVITNNFDNNNIIAQGVKSSHMFEGMELPSFMKEGFSILTPGGKVSSDSGEKKKDVTTTTQTVTTTTLSVPFVTESTTTTVPVASTTTLTPNISSSLLTLPLDASNLQGHEIIFQGQKYILAKPEVLSLLTKTYKSMETKSEVEVVPEIKSEVKIVPEIKNEQKVVSQSKSEEKVLTPTKDEEKSFSTEENVSASEEKQMNVVINKPEKAEEKTYSETGAFVQIGSPLLKKYAEKPETIEPAIEIQKSVKQSMYEDEQIKAAEEQRKSLLASRYENKNVVTIPEIKQNVPTAILPEKQFNYENSELKSLIEQADRINLKLKEASLINTQPIVSPVPDTVMSNYAKVPHYQNRRIVLKSKSEVETEENVQPTLSPLNLHRIRGHSEELFEPKIVKPAHPTEGVIITTSATDIESYRQEELRRVFNEQRKALALRSRQMFHRGKERYEKKVTEIPKLFCQTLRDFSQHENNPDIVELASENCKTIISYNPELTCSKVLDFARHCVLISKLRKKF